MLCSPDIRDQHLNSHQDINTNPAVQVMRKKNQSPRGKVPFGSLLSALNELLWTLTAKIHLIHDCSI